MNDQELVKAEDESKSTEPVAAATDKSAFEPDLTAETTQSVAGSTDEPNTGPEETAEAAETDIEENASEPDVAAETTQPVAASTEPDTEPTETAEAAESEFDKNAPDPDVEMETAESSTEPDAVAKETPEGSPSPAEAEDEGGDITSSILALQRGQHLNGKVKNIAGFGAFVDIGLPQDGLIHISELSRKKVDKVEDVVTVDQEVDVWVKKVDRKRGRISLTMIKPVSLRLRDIDEGQELTGTITRLESYGAFIDIGSERDGLVHISQITHEYIKHPEDVLTVGESVQVKILKVNRKKRQVDLSIKALLASPKEEIEQELEVEAVPEEEAGEAEAVPTAMALAYAAMKDKKKPASASKNTNDTKEKQQQELDEIIARTLATGD
jgi:predicted RNA-binding protein with RPS1 domain